MTNLQRRIRKLEALSSPRGPVRLVVRYETGDPQDTDETESDVDENDPNTLGRSCAVRRCARKITSEPILKMVARRVRRLEAQIQPALRAIAAVDPAATDRLRKALAGAGFTARESMRFHCPRLSSL